MMIDYTKYLLPLLFGKELEQVMINLPIYDENSRFLPAPERLMKLTDIYKVFIPSAMSSEIYHKLYMMTTMSLKQKGTIEAIQQMNANHNWASGGEYKGIITGASSATVIGDSGIGKTTCVQKAAELLGPVIEAKKPLRKIVPVVLVSCPFDSSYKGLLLQILIAIDEELETGYYEKTVRSNYNSQQILALVCQLCHLHVGVLVIDEIQFLVEHRAGTQLYRMILQLINASGISVMLIGTNECLDYFQQAPQMARRMTGLQYHNLDYSKEFRNLATELFRYQFVRGRTELTESMLSWLFEHTAGNPANLMALLHDAQEIAILKGYERIDIMSLTEAYSRRMQMLRPYIEAKQTKLPQTSKKKREKSLEMPVNETHISDMLPIPELARKIRENGESPIAEYRKDFSVEEVAV